MNSKLQLIRVTEFITSFDNREMNHIMRMIEVDKIMEIIEQTKASAHETAKAQARDMVMQGTLWEWVGPRQLDAWSKAVDCYREAIKIDEQSGDAHYQLAHCYALGLGSRRDWESAIQEFILAAELGNKDALNDLAVFYATGQHVEQSTDKAIELLERAHGKDDEYAAEAWFNHGLLCEQLGKNGEAEVKYMKSSLWQAQNNLAICNYEQGSTDPEEVQLLLEGACDKCGNDPRPWYNLALITNNAQQKRVYWINAADRGYDKACVRIARCYLDGDRIEKNRDKAIHYYTIAANQGNRTAINALRTLRVR